MSRVENTLHVLRPGRSYSAAFGAFFFFFLS